MACRYGHPETRLGAGSLLYPSLVCAARGREDARIVLTAMIPDRTRETRRGKEDFGNSGRFSSCLFPSEVSIVGN